MELGKSKMDSATAINMSIAKTEIAHLNEGLGALSTDSFESNAVTEFLEINFSGQRLNVKMTGTPEKNRAVVNLVQDRLSAAEKKGSGNSPSHWVAVQSLFELAEEYIESKHRFQSFQKDLASCLPTKES
jgi:hypothetical protein